MSPCTQAVLAGRTEHFCHWESGISAWCGSAHKIRCLGEPADWNKKEAAEELEGRNVLFSFFFYLRVLTCFLKESQQGWVIGRGRGTAQWRNASPLCLGQAMEIVRWGASRAGGAKGAEEEMPAEVSRGLCPSSRVLQESLNDGEWHSLVMALSTERRCNRVLSLGRTQAVVQLPGGVPEPPEAQGPTSWARLRAQVESRGCSLQVGRSQVLGGTHRTGPLVTVSPIPSSPEVKAGYALRGRSLWGFKAAVSPQWKAGSVRVVVAPGEDSMGGTRCANHAWLLAVLQCWRSWAHSW